MTHRIQTASRFASSTRLDNAPYAVPVLDSTQLYIFGELIIDFEIKIGHWWLSSEGHSLPDPLGRRSAVCSGRFLAGTILLASKLNSGSVCRQLKSTAVEEYGS